MIHKQPDGAFVISSQHTWRPGCYKTSATARYAFQFPDSELQRLQENLNPNGIITMDHLKQLREQISLAAAASAA